jgi:alginate O-acetyltransferase complex protein AlgI
MLFTEPGFLFLLLPLLAVTYFWLPLRLKNVWLLASSIFFYWWGERLFVLILASIAINYCLGYLVDKERFPRWSRYWVWAAVAINLGLLGVYKYGNFTLESVDGLLTALGFAATGDPYQVPIHLPIGISFYTFQGLSYVLDVHWGLSKKQRNPLYLGLYISLFPQLIAGPIVRYREIADQIDQRESRLDDVIIGAERFVIGLGKKMIIANGVAGCADAIFATPTEQLSMGAAWLGLFCYTIQLYFDFSGYSDMAIGLGRMFGFKLPENFRYPYVSRSITELWQRWHITLSNWLRDYLFFPLAGKRPSPGRIKAVLFTVFLACGLWHGAAWTFVVWGAWNGVFLVIERGAFGSWLGKRPMAIAWCYTMAIWMAGLVLFRSPDLAYAASFAGCLIGLGGSDPIPALAFATGETWPSLAMGLLGSAPLIPWLAARFAERSPGLLAWAKALALAVVFLIAVLLAAGRTYNPFLYFQF